MSSVDRLQNGTLEFFEDYNKRYDRGDFRGSEATKYNLDAIKKWIAIRDGYTYTKDTDGKGWTCLDITQSHSKYGVNYIYFHKERKLWRIMQTISEFYGGGTVD